MRITAQVYGYKEVNKKNERYKGWWKINEIYSEKYNLQKHLNSKGEYDQKNKTPTEKQKMLDDRLGLWLNNILKRELETVSEWC